MRELELAGFHLLSHVGGEVIGESERGAKQLGLEEMERFGTADVGKVTDSRARRAGGHGGPCSVLQTRSPYFLQLRGRSRKWVVA